MVGTVTLPFLLRFASVSFHLSHFEFTCAEYSSMGKYFSLRCPIKFSQDVNCCSSENKIVGFHSYTASFSGLIF